jgi:hypothetical protein
MLCVLPLMLQEEMTILKYVLVTTYSSVTQEFKEGR